MPSQDFTKFLGHFINVFQRFICFVGNFVSSLARTEDFKTYFVHKIHIVTFLFSTGLCFFVDFFCFFEFVGVFVMTIKCGRALEPRLSFSCQLMGNLQKNNTITWVVRFFVIWNINPKSPKSWIIFKDCKTKCCWSHSGKIWKYQKLINRTHRGKNIHESLL